MLLTFPMFQLGHFYLNQDEITQIHCENKEKPERNCHGRCYLKKQLSLSLKTNDVEKEASLEFNIFMPYAFNDIAEVSVSDYLTLQEKVIPGYEIGKLSQFHSKIFHPPQLMS